MGTRKEKSFAFLWALVCALSFGIVACGDEVSPSGAETPESSSAMPEGGDFSANFSSSSYYYWGFSSGSVIGAQTGDSLESGDTLVPQDFLSHDTDWVLNPDSVYYLRRLAVDGRVSALFGLSPNSSMKIEYLDTQSGISSNGVDSGSVSVVEATFPVIYWKPYVRVSIEGVALDFPGAPTVAGLSLSALGDLSSNDTVNVDFISTAELSRAETLVAAGQDLAVAMEQAATEVLRAFHMDDFADDLPKEEVAARYIAIHLLAASRVAEGDGFTFDDIATDIADDGLWSDTASRAKIADWALRADAEDAFASLRTALSTQEVGGFEKYLRLFYQKELGIPACADNAGAMLHVANVASRYYVADDLDFTKVADRFVCIAEGGVAFASDSLKDIVSLGTGADGEVRPGAFSGNIFYTYDASLGEWRLSTELEKDSYFVQISATNTFVDIQDVYDGLKDNERVIFVIRHGKRGDDTSISGTLTSDGKAQAKDLGSRLTKHEEDFLLGASEFLRAHQTVEYIAIGRGQQSDIRDTFPELNDNWYEKNHDASEKAKSECGGGWELTSKYAYTGAYTTGENAAFYKLDERSVELIVDVLLAKYNDPSHRFVMLSSHDKVMVPLVAYCTNFKVNLRKYDGGKWLNYLAGVAIIVDELGNRRYVPVKGLDSAYM